MTPADEKARHSYRRRAGATPTYYGQGGRWPEAWLIPGSAGVPPAYERARGPRSYAAERTRPEG